MNEAVGMGEEWAALHRVVPFMQTPLRDYGRLIRRVLGDGAKALTIFGRIATHSFDAHRDRARSVLIVDRIDLSVLRQLAGHGPRLGKLHIAAPLIMTPAYIQGSLDTFPLEFIEIQQQHVTVFGDDHFEALAFEDKHIRLQCERELKVILIGLRQGLLAAAGREKLLISLERNVGEALIRTLRGLLWLKGQRPGKPADEVVGELERLAHRQLPGVRAALDPQAPHGWPEFERLYLDVEALGEIVNAW